MEHFVSTTTDYGYRSYRFESEGSATDYLTKELKGLKAEGFALTATQPGPSLTDYTLRNDYDDVVEIRFQKVA